MKQRSLIPDVVPDKILKTKDSRPLPLIVAEQWDFPLQYHASNGKTFFSIQDWIAGVAKTDNAKRFWSDMQKRLEKSGNELYASCVQLPYHASNGKTYQMDFADDVTLYQITQRMDVNTGLRDVILVYLAKSGAIIDDARRNGNLERLARSEGIEKRKDFTATIKKKSKRFNKYLIGRATNTIYSKLFRIGTEYTAKKMIVAELGLSDKEARNMRDYLNRLANKAIEMAEEAATVKIDNYPVQLSDDEILHIVKHCARIVAVSANELADYAGVDLLSGKFLLSAKN